MWATTLVALQVEDAPSGAWMPGAAAAAGGPTSDLIFIIFFFFNRVLFLWSASCCCIICRSCFFFSLLESQIPHLFKFLFLFFFFPPVFDRSLSSAHLYFLFFVFL
jgi:hypothetical protein